MLKPMLAFTLIFAAPALAIAQSGRAAQDSRLQEPRLQDARTTCIRETEKTYPPRSISRQLRDRYVEECVRRRAR